MQTDGIQTCMFEDIAEPLGAAGLMDDLHLAKSACAAHMVPGVEDQISQLLLRDMIRCFDGAVIVRIGIGKAG